MIVGANQTSHPKEKAMLMEACLNRNELTADYKYLKVDTL